jgi:four helix bundle protein
MSSVKRFEDLIAWQKGRLLAQQIYLACRQPPLKSDRRLVSQIQSAAVSVISNIAEGFERGGPAEFHQFLVTAKASCAEVRTQLYLIKDIGYLDSARADRLLDLANEVGRILGGLKAAVKEMRDRGEK